MPPHGPASGEDTAPESFLAALLKAMHRPTDWSLPAHRGGTRCTYVLVSAYAASMPRKVPRWWAGKDPAARPQISLQWTGVT
ncbi:hypothetical protein BI311_24985 [Xanthomonas citri pv. citri]|nr:hypothetical protein BI311_24985 [Xanthomonas citri pv. citri]